MLINLHVKNIALIDEVDVEFTSGLNILTGETGAGKSILLGAVNLALGKKTAGDSIGKFGSYGLVELVFQVENKEVRRVLEEKEIFLEEEQVILTRKITSGRSICKINGETCTVSQMKEVASLLLDIHGQQEHQKLLSQDYQLSVLDGFSSQSVKEYKLKTASAFEEYQQLTRQLDSYSMDEEQRLRELSFIEFEIQEIGEAGLQEEEDIQLEKQYRRLQNARKISEGLQLAHGFLGYEHPGQAGEQISAALKEVVGLKDFDEQIAVIHGMLLDMESMLNDVNREISSYMGELIYSEGEFQQIDQRLNTINGLKAKYGVSIEAIISYQMKQQERQKELLDFDKRKEQLKKEQQQAERVLECLCQELTIIRKENALKFEKQLKNALRDLNFMDVDFEIVFTEFQHYTKNGRDGISFFISTNPGEEKKPIAKVLSGGELSRVMLAVKALIADMEDTGTQIFDEIDTGISGRTAQMVAEKLELISRERQILCITHLPQIAAMADTHFEIRKKLTKPVTTQIFPLQESESTEEIARMLGGAKITDRVRNNAKEMKDLARVHKNTRVK